MPQCEGTGDKRRAAVVRENLRVVRVANFQIGVDALPLPNARAVEDAGITRRREPVQVAIHPHAVAIAGRISHPPHQHRSGSAHRFAPEGQGFQAQLEARLRGRFLIDHAHGLHHAPLGGDTGRQRCTRPGIQEISVPGEKERGGCSPCAEGRRADDALRLWAFAQSQPTRTKKTQERHSSCPRPEHGAGR